MKEEQEKKELEQASEYSFIKEKIKERPKNKKKIALQWGGFLAGAVIFGAIASLVMVVMTPWLEEMMYGKDEPEGVTIPKDELSSSETTITPTQTPVPTQEPVVNVVEKNLETKDYINLYSQIYHVADSVKNSLVTVVGVSNNVDWLNNPYENEGQASGGERQ